MSHLIPTLKYRRKVVNYNKLYNGSRFNLLTTVTIQYCTAIIVRCYSMKVLIETKITFHKYTPTLYYSRSSRYSAPRPVVYKCYRTAYTCDALRMRWMMQSSHSSSHRTLATRQRLGDATHNTLCCVVMDYSACIH